MIFVAALQASTFFCNRLPGPALRFSPGYQMTALQACEMPCFVSFAFFCGHKMVEG